MFSVHVTKFLSVQNDDVDSEKIRNFAAVRDYQMLLGLSMHFWKGNKLVKFRAKFQAVAQKMADNFEGYFSTHPV